MVNHRIYLGVDTQSNLAISIEAVGKGFFYLTVSTTDQDVEVCRFVCSEEELEDIVSKRSIEIRGSEGRCTIRPSGDEVVFEITRLGEQEANTCALSANSFSRVVRLAKNRAFAS